MGRALTSWSRNIRIWQARLSLGDEPHNWFSEPSEMVAERAVIREIFEVPETADIATGADRIVMQIHEVVQVFRRLRRQPHPIEFQMSPL